MAREGDSKTLSAGEALGPIGSKAPECAALVVAWCADEPRRVGEIAFFPPRERSRTLGRGDVDGGLRVRFAEQRPGQLRLTEPLAGLAISRRQLTVGPAKGGLDVERVGRCPLSVNGVAADRARVTPGDALLLRGQLLLLCTRRVRTMPNLAHFPKERFGPFGELDAMGILGESPPIWELRDQLAFAASSGKHVLLHGQSGTGKELAARAIHRLSSRAAMPFVSRNAATLPSGLIDAELFGNARNYPNPGMAERGGLIGQADGGVLFLDEIGELLPEQQAHLLRVLDADGEYQRLGDAAVRRSKFILVAATNRPLEALKHELLARLTLRVELPSLEARREDIPLLVRHLLRSAATSNAAVCSRFLREAKDGGLEPRVDPALVECLLGRSYDANVRELEALLWRAMARSPGDVVSLTDELRDESSVRGEPGAAQIRDAIRRAGGSVKDAARALGLRSRFALYRLMKKRHIVAGVPGEPE